ncbi:MAG: response regulator transcription factor [Pirellulales bacterium]|nr:response regulator transcription factor [Pirellulales bacterium]
MKRFLIVDDEDLCGELIAAFLEPYGQCDYAHNGQEAVTAVRLAIEDGEPYDAVCLDIMMPEMDGHHALPAIRKTEEKLGIMGSDGTKVIMVTALRESTHCIKSFHEGCESYVTKPVTEAAVLEKMRELGVIADAVPAN